MLSDDDIWAKQQAKDAKDTKIKVEIRRLKSLFKDMPKDTAKAIKTLIDNAAFMAVTLEELQEHINLHGVTDTYQNGENQWGTKKSPEVEIHIAMTKNFNATLKQLTDLLPKAQPQPKDDGFDDFIHDR